MPIVTVTVTAMLMLTVMVTVTGELTKYIEAQNTVWPVGGFFGFLAREGIGARGGGSVPTGSTATFLGLVSGSLGGFCEVRRS
jgi:hypothetical protein